MKHKSILILICVCCVLWLGITVNMPSDRNTLRGSFGFYKGSINMSEIKEVSFSKVAPDSYDESWIASIADDGNITGYRCGNTVTIVGSKIYANPRCSYTFAAENSYGGLLWANLTSINGLELLDTSLVTNMKMMFAFTRVSELSGIENWDVSSVTSFAGMFQGHSHVGDVPLKYIDVGKWDTSSATNMSHVFYGCGQMESIPIDNWDVSNVTTVSHMFADCFSLKTINLSNWETVCVESFDGFLNDCRSLTSADVSGLETGACKQFSQMFEACVNLEQIIGLEEWDVSKASHYAFTEMFHGCHKLMEINIGSWRAIPDNTARMFKNCYSLTEVDLSGIDMSEVTNYEEMFSGCNIWVDMHQMMEAFKAKPPERIVKPKPSIRKDGLMVRDNCRRRNGFPIITEIMFNER